MPSSRPSPLASRTHLTIDDFFAPGTSDMDLGGIAGPRSEGNMAPESDILHGGADHIAPEIDMTAEASSLGGKDQTTQTSVTATEVEKEKASAQPQP